MLPLSTFSAIFVFKKYKIYLAIFIANIYLFPTDTNGFEFHNQKYEQKVANYARLVALVLEAPNCQQWLEHYSPSTVTSWLSKSVLTETQNIPVFG